MQRVKISMINDIRGQNVTKKKISFIMTSDVCPVYTCDFFFFFQEE